MLGKQNKHSKVNELKLEENILNNPKDIAEGFNSYFSNIGPDLASQIHTSSCNFGHVLKPGRWTMDDGRWTMDDGRWTMDDGRWTMDDGRWTMDDGRWTSIVRVRD